MSSTQLPGKTFDLNGSVGDWLEQPLNVQAVERLHIEALLASGTWSTAVVEVLKSGTGAEYYSFSPALTLGGASRVVDIDVHDAAFVQLEIDTAEGGAGIASFQFYGDDGSSLIDGSSLDTVTTLVTDPLVPVQGATNGGTPVEIVPDPTAGYHARLEKGDLAVLNEDTVAVTMILTLNSVVIERLVMPPGSKYVNDDRLVVEASDTLTVELGGAVTTTEPNWHACYRVEAD